MVLSVNLGEEANIEDTVALNDLQFLGSLGVVLGVEVFPAV